MSDLHFDRALRAAARRGRPEGVCPDAAALASYVDGSLSLAERAALEAHVASCPSCTEHLALLAAVDTPETPAADGWPYARVFGSWRWLVPVATAVLVVAVWLRLPSREGAPASADTALSARKTVASAPVSAAAPASVAANTPQADQPAADAKEEGRAKGAALADTQARSNEARQLEASKQKAEMTGLQSKAVDALKVRERDEAAAGARQDMTAAAVAPKPASPASAQPPMLVSETKADARADADAGAKTAAKDTALPPMAETVAGAPVQQGAAGGALALRKAAVVTPLEVSGPGVRMRALNGRFERSTDAGTTWIVEHAGVAGQVLTGACPTTDVCWFGGDDGQVFVRAAGSWVVRRIPDVHVAVVALKVTSSDAADATLADGRRFETRDGGRTWSASQ